MPKPQPITPRLLKVKDAARYLSLSAWTLRRMVQKGELPAIVPGSGPWLIDVADLSAWIERRKVTL